MNSGKVVIKYDNGDVLTIYCNWEDNMSLYIESEDATWHADGLGNEWYTNDEGDYWYY